MKTRNQIYSEDASDLLRTITMYKTILEAQIFRMYPPDKERVIKNLLTHLLRQGRIYYNPECKRYSANKECDENPDYGMILSLWILVDFINIIEFHTASDFPIKISFLANGELYDIIHIPYEQEQLMNHALSGKNESLSQRIILIDNPEQIPKINILNVSGFCTADRNGCVRYFKFE